MVVDFSIPYRQEFLCSAKNYAFIYYGGLEASSLYAVFVC